MKIYEVGGCVRDRLMGLDPRDIDYVVVGSTPEEMLSLGYEQVGKDFPVFLHPVTGDEYALARIERKTGVGYTGFTTETHNVTLEDDLKRRDLTINAIAMTPGDIIDPYGGQKDITLGVLRHVSSHFCEDPVRILRVARFAARYNFCVAPETYDLMRGMVGSGEFDSLTGERVWKELEKTLTEPHVANFFMVLSHIGALQKIFSFSSLKNPEMLTQDFEHNLVHIFSQDSGYKNWKMPEEHKTLVSLYIKYKNTTYETMDAVARLEFLTQTRAIHDPTLAQKVLRLNLSATDQFDSDVQKLKNIDYLAISQSVDKKSIRQAIHSAQLQALSQKTLKRSMK